MEEQNKNELQPAEEQPTSPPIQEQLAALKAQAEESTNERNRLRETLQRAQADFINYKRRIEEERGERERYASTRLILKLIPALDDFNLALDHVSESDADPSWLEGIKLVQRKLISLLDSENVTKIEVQGREFDPLEHEAMAYEESTEQLEGHISTVIRDGYKLHGRVIRPALVTLAKRPAVPQE